MIDNFLRRPGTPAELIAAGLRVAGLASIVVAALGWGPTAGGILALALPALLVPRFVGARAGFDITYQLVVLVAAWSNVLGLYESVNGWDLVVHFACTGVIALVVYLLLAHLDIVPRPTAADVTPRIAVTLAGMIGLAVSALWEMIEWIGYTFVSDKIFVTYDDTIGDMALGGLGALLAGAVLARARLTRIDAFRPPASAGDVQSGSSRSSNSSRASRARARRAASGSSHQ
ncbi:DUF2238 domain-containing protein [Microbacterium sp. P05]|uniref:DUF2238 domain-containing protein n=1 Tax=Microbacterium sp. P05 TaxID=3366948 RepID=UPI003746C47F